ncbi:MAG: serine protease [Candidatus Magnetomorum sp.]|nr:serine protease [Candidatus Magnetomorum sp.]
MKRFFFILCILLSVQLLIQSVMADSVRKQPRIVGGIASQNEDWPFMAAMVNTYGEAQCGGTLIHYRWIVTAAHCLENTSGGWVAPGFFKVVIGLKDLSQNQHAYIYEIERIIPHPEYDSYLVDNDIALLQLKTEVSSTYPPIAVYQGDVSSLIGTVLGWGNTVLYNPDDPDNPSYYPRYPDQLMQVVLPVVSMEQCIDSTTYQITDNMFCAGYTQGQKDACDGDSGGPFVVYSDHQWKLAGIVSWGEGCAWPGYYGFYTLVPNYISFIQNYVPLNESFQGDINKDEQVDLKDVLAIMKYLANSTSQTVILSAPIESCISVSAPMPAKTE